MYLIVDDNWELITKDGKYPSEIDIDMAFERVIVKDYMNTNEEISTISDSGVCDLDISPLFAPAYLINMKFVIIDQTEQFSVDLRNYGYEKAKIKLKKDETKRKFAKSCFYVQLERNTEICQCESTILHIIFSPKKEMFSQRKTDVTHKFYLEVSNMNLF